MKKWKLLLFLLITLFSCGSDDSSTTEPTNNSDTTNNLQDSPNLLIGKWDVTSIVIGDEVLEAEDCELTSTLEFNSDGTYKEQTFGGLIGGPCIADPLESGDWILSSDNKAITVTPKGKRIRVLRILELTETALKYEFDGIDILEDGTVPFIEVWTFVKS